MSALAVGLAVTFVVTELAHFMSPLRDDPVALVPPQLPQPGLLVTLPGVAELLGAVGPPIPATRATAAIGPLGLMLVMFPANVYVSRMHAPPKSITTQLSVRIAEEVMFLAIALVVAIGSVWSAALLATCSAAAVFAATGGVTGKPWTSCTVMLLHRRNAGKAAFQLRFRHDHPHSCGSPRVALVSSGGLPKEGGALTLRVDPALLRAFSAHVETASATIDAAGMGHLTSAGADGLEGSATQWMARLVGEHLAGVEAKIANGVRDMGGAVRGAGDRYEVDDGDLATTFTGLF